MDINEFIKKFCKKCNNNCDRGMVEKNNFIRCIDRDIYINKNIDKIEKNN